MSKDTPCIVAQRMKEQRKRLKKTQKDIAERAELSTKHINNLEHMAAPTLSVDTFIRLCDALECSADYLLGKDSLPTHELSDIHSLTDLSSDAIETLIEICSYKKDLKKQGTIHTSDRAADYGLITGFISHMIVNMDYDIVLRHLNASAWSQIYEEEEAGLKIDDQRLNDMAYMNHQIMTASELREKAISNRDTSDATAWRFSQMAAEVLDSFSEQQVPFVKDHIKNTEAKYERYLYEKFEKESEQMITEREV